MAKTTTKKTKIGTSKSKSKSKKVIVKKSTKSVKSKKPMVRKKATVVVKKPSVKKVSAKKAMPKSKMVKTVTPFNFKKLMDDKAKMAKLLILLVVIGSVYLLKDVFVVATVNGTPVFRWSVISRLERQGGRQILDSLVTEKLVDQAIRKSGVVVKQEEIDASLAEIEARLTAQGMDLNQALKEQGMTREELVKDIVLQKSVEKIVAEDVEITDEEVDAYIVENKEFFPAGTDPVAIRETVREQLKSLASNEKIQSSWHGHPFYRVSHRQTFPRV